MPPQLPDELPIFPLGQVLFPAGLLRLQIFEPRYLAMTARCLAEQSPFGVSLIRAGFEVGTPAIPSLIGCAARIVEAEQPVPDRYRLLARGETRFRIVERRIDGRGLIHAQVEWLEPPDPSPLPTRHARLASQLREVYEAMGPDAPLPRPLRLEDAAWVANRWAELLPVTPERRQLWLERDVSVAVLAEIEQLLDEHAAGGTPEA